MKQQRLKEYRQYCLRDLRDMRYVYFLVDGINSPVRQNDRLCLLVLSISLSMSV
ncbi:MAG: hypothetical protein ACTS73_06050 [Arsenophonus sp. NEOnobi-MAG3]